MENPALPSDLADFGYDGPASEAVQKSWLNAVWRRLCRELRTHGVDPETLHEHDLRDVVVGATLRVLRNPEGIEQESGAIDDYNESFKRANASEDIYFTAAELRGLIPLVDAMSSWAGSVKYQ